MAIIKEDELFIVTPTNSKERLGAFNDIGVAVTFQRLLHRFGGLKRKNVVDAMTELKRIGGDWALADPLRL